MRMVLLLLEGMRVGECVLIMIIRLLLINRLGRVIIDIMLIDCLCLMSVVVMMMIEC